MKQLSDPDGRYIFCDFKAEDKIWTLLNVYAPNQDEPTFFEQIQDLLASFECEQIIFGGDFNLILDIIKDKSGGKKTTHYKSLKKLESIMENLDLVDIWRIQNPDTKCYTWRRKNPNIQCRLDFFLISSSLCPDISETDILPGYKTDHFLVTLAIDLHTNPRGPGFWKLNTSLLYDHEFVGLIKKTISDVSKQYENDSEVNDILLWEVIKMEVRASSIVYAKQKKTFMKSKEVDLESKIANLQKDLDDSITEVDRETLTMQLEGYKQELEKLIEYKTKGSIIRSKTRWYNEGEKNTKSFLGLEKRHFNKKNYKKFKIREWQLCWLRQEDPRGSK